MDVVDIIVCDDIDFCDCDCQNPRVNNIDNPDNLKYCIIFVTIIIPIKIKPLR